MKRIILIGKQEDRRSFLEQLHTDEEGKLIIDNEEILFIERNPKSFKYLAAIVADYAVCIGLHEENEICLRSLHDIPSTIYFPEEKEPPLHFIKESLKFEKIAASDNDKTQQMEDAFISPAVAKPETILSRLSVLCKTVTRPTKKEEWIEMKTMNPANPAKVP